VKNNHKNNFKIVFFEIIFLTYEKSKTMVIVELFQNQPGLGASSRNSTTISGVQNGKEI
jgi:hypothetical protein